MLYEILIFLFLYHIDMFSAILVWKFKPNLFKVSEANEQFKRLLNKYSIPKAILNYTLVVSIQFVIIIVLAIFFTLKIITNQWEFLHALRFSLIFMCFLHLIGTLTNLLTLLKDEIQIK